MVNFASQLVVAAVWNCAIANPVATRQISPIWNDQYIKAPRLFKVTKIHRCMYQLTFERDFVDSRYDYSFEAVYETGGQSIPIKPITGGIAISRVEPIGSNQSPTNRYRIGDSRVLSVHQFNNACVNNQQPIAFIVLAHLGCCYTYKNKYRTSQISITSEEVPRVPRNVEITRVTNGFLVKWDGVSDASGYYALAAGTTPNSEVGEVNIITTVKTDNAGRNATFDARTQTIAIVAAGAPGVVSRTGGVPDLAVPKR